MALSRRVNERFTSIYTRMRTLEKTNADLTARMSELEETVQLRRMLDD